jgi:LuxR family maltose regulon positive regulatory protein
MAYHLQGKPDEAQAVLEAAGTFMLETGNTTLMPYIQAFEAELALKQGNFVVADRWATQFAPISPLTPIYGFFSPHLTVVKVWLAQDTPTSGQQAADLLDRVRVFVESTHNTRFLIEVLALQTLLNDRQGERQSALELLEQAATLAQPGDFIRLFVDFGPQMADLLAELKIQNSNMQPYLDQILATFGKDEEVHPAPLAEQDFILHPLVDPLTNREQEVLECLGLTDKEISQHLVISPHTVRTHIKGIFGKLNVVNRRQAIARAQELGLLPSK